MLHHRLLDKDKKLWKGFAARVVVDTCDDRDTEGLFRLTCPPLLEEGEPERVYKDDLSGFLPRETGFDEASCNNVDVIVAALPDEHALNEVDTARDAETCATKRTEPLKQDEERAYVFEGTRVWACLHHPELELVESSCAVKTNNRGGLNLCAACADPCDCKDEGNARNARCLGKRGKSDSGSSGCGSSEWHGKDSFA
eukprot:1758420-Amphidinium_carterae.2